jgi:hypothetical protein
MHYPHRTQIASRVTAFADFVIAELKTEESLKVKAKDCADFMTLQSGAKPR